MLIEDGILSILEAIRCGGLMLDAKGRVLQTNQKARRYLGSELDIRHRGSPPESAASNERMQIALREAVRASTQVMPQLGNFITVPRGASRPLLLRRILVPGQAGSNEEPTAAVIVLDMEDCLLPDEDLLRDVFLSHPGRNLARA